MPQFIVAGVGHSGTTALALALNLHPNIYCAIEQLNHEHDHTGLLSDPETLLNDEHRPSLHTRSNREFLAGKAADQLLAIGNKWPNYHLRWNGVLSELSDPRAIVIIRDLESTIASWNLHVERGFDPPEMPGAYAALDLPEVIRQATQSKFAASTLIVSYKALLYGKRSADVFDEVLAHLGLKSTPEITASFLHQFANDAFVATGRPPLDPRDQALAESVPIAEFLKEMEERGTCRGDQTIMASETLVRIEENAKDITERLFACLEKSHSDALAEPGLRRQIGHRTHDLDGMPMRIIRDRDAFIERGNGNARDVRDASGLDAGDIHYRAYVGPPERFDLMSLSQVGLLHKFGLREHHYVLDFGCGSLRLGRMLLPYLLPQRYFGIEPNGWLVEQGFLYETGQDIRAIKQPSFSYDSAFDCTVFGRQFDFIVAQSIITHTGRSEAQTLFESASRALLDSGVFLFSFAADEKLGPRAPLTGWIYPGCVSFTHADLDEFCAKAGLSWTTLDWHHPGATWAVAARSRDNLVPKAS